MGCAIWLWSDIVLSKKESYLAAALFAFALTRRTLRLNDLLVKCWFSRQMLILVGRVFYLNLVDLLERSKG